MVTRRRRSPICPRWIRMPTCSTSLSGASSDRGLWRATAGRDGTGRINGLSEAPRGTAPHTSAGSDRTREPVGSGGRKANAGEVARSMAARERSSRALAEAQRICHRLPRTPHRAQRFAATPLCPALRRFCGHNSDSVHGRSVGASNCCSVEKLAGLRTRRTSCRLRPRT